MSKKDKIPFKDRPIGKALAKIAPLADLGLDLATSAFPALAPVNMAVDAAKAIAKKKKLPLGELNEAHELYKIDYVKMLELEVEDRKSARDRQIRMAELGKIDWMFYLVGLTGLGVFTFIIWAIVGGKLHEGPLVHVIVGEVMGIATSIFMFYFGSSQGSKDKDKK